MTLNGDVADDVRRARPHEGEADDFFRRLALAARRDPAPRALRDLAVAAHRLILRHASSTAAAPASSPGSAADEPGSAADQPGSAADEPGSAADQPRFAADEPGLPPAPDGNGHTGRPRLPNGRYAPTPPHQDEVDAMAAVMEHLGHLAAEAVSEADALAPAAALVPLALPADRSPDVVPGLLTAATALTRGLYSDPAIRPLVRLVPGLLRASFAAGAGPDPVAALAAEARRVLADPLACVAGYDRSTAADLRYHAAGTRP